MNPAHFTLILIWVKACFQSERTCQAALSQRDSLYLILSSHSFLAPISAHGDTGYIRCLYQAILFHFQIISGVSKMIIDRLLSNIKGMSYI
jgi:hypothetical protein